MGPGQECLASNRNLEAGLPRKLCLGLVPQEVDPAGPPWGTPRTTRLGGPLPSACQGEENRDTVVGVGRWGQGSLEAP